MIKPIYTWTNTFIRTGWKVVRKIRQEKKNVDFLNEHSDGLFLENLEERQMLSGSDPFGDFTDNSIPGEVSGPLDPSGGTGSSTGGTGGGASTGGDAGNDPNLNGDPTTPGWGTLMASVRTLDNRLSETSSDQKDSGKVRFRLEGINSNTGPTRIYFSVVGATVGTDITFQSEAYGYGSSPSGNGHYILIDEGSASADLEILAVNDANKEATTSFQIQLSPNPSLDLDSERNSAELFLDDNDSWNVYLQNIDGVAAEENSSADPEEEQYSDYATVRVWREGTSDLSNDLQVYFDVTTSVNQASTGDFEIAAEDSGYSSNTTGRYITILAGKSYADISIRTTADSEDEGIESFGIELKENANYRVDSARNQTEIMLLDAVGGSSTQLTYDDHFTVSSTGSTVLDVLENDRNHGGGLNVVGLGIGQYTSYRFKQKTLNVGNATLTIKNGKVVFTPDGQFHGSQVFYYTTENENGRIDTGKVTVSVVSSETLDRSRNNDDFSILEDETSWEYLNYKNYDLGNIYGPNTVDYFEDVPAPESGEQAGYEGNRVFHSLPTNTQPSGSYEFERGSYFNRFNPHENATNLNQQDTDQTIYNLAIGSQVYQIDDSWTWSIQINTNGTTWTYNELFTYQYSASSNWNFDGIDKEVNSSGWYRYEFSASGTNGISGSSSFQLTETKWDESVLTWDFDKLNLDGTTVDDVEFGGIRRATQDFEFTASGTENSTGSAQQSHHVVSGTVSDTRNFEKEYSIPDGLKIITSESGTYIQWDYDQEKNSSTDAAGTQATSSSYDYRIRRKLKAENNNSTDPAVDNYRTETVSTNTGDTSEYSTETSNYDDEITLNTSSDLHFWGNRGTNSDSDEYHLEKDITTIREHSISNTKSVSAHPEDETKINSNSSQTSTTNVVGTATLVTDGSKSYGSQSNSFSSSTDYHSTQQTSWNLTQNEEHSGTSQKTDNSSGTLDSEVTGFHSGIATQTVDFETIENGVGGQSTRTEEFQSVRTSSGQGTLDSTHETTGSYANDDNTNTAEFQSQNSYDANLLWNTSSTLNGDIDDGYWEWDRTAFYDSLATGNLQTSSSAELISTGTDSYSLDGVEFDSSTNSKVFQSGSSNLEFTAQSNGNYSTLAGIYLSNATNTLTSSGTGLRKVVEESTRNSETKKDQNSSTNVFETIVTETQNHNFTSDTDYSISENTLQTTIQNGSDIEADYSHTSTQIGSTVSLDHNANLSESVTDSSLFDSTIINSNNSNRSGNLTWTEVDNITISSDSVGSNLEVYETNYSENGTYQLNETVNFSKNEIDNRTSGVTKTVELSAIDTLVGTGISSATEYEKNTFSSSAAPEYIGNTESESVDSGIKTSVANSTSTVVGTEAINHVSTLSSDSAFVRNETQISNFHDEINDQSSISISDGVTTQSSSTERIITEDGTLDWASELDEVKTTTDHPVDIQLFSEKRIEKHIDKTYDGDFTSEYRYYRQYHQDGSQTTIQEDGRSDDGTLSTPNYQIISTYTRSDGQDVEGNYDLSKKPNEQEFVGQAKYFKQTNDLTGSTESTTSSSYDHIETTQIDSSQNRVTSEVSEYQGSATTTSDSVEVSTAHSQTIDRELKAAPGSATEVVQTYFSNSQNTEVADGTTLSSYSGKIERQATKNHGSSESQTTTEQSQSNSTYNGNSLIDSSGTYNRGMVQIVQADGNPVYPDDPTLSSIATVSITDYVGNSDNDVSIIQSTSYDLKADGTDLSQYNYNKEVDSLWGDSSSTISAFAMHSFSQQVIETSSQIVPQGDAAQAEFDAVNPKMVALDSFDINQKLSLQSGEPIANRLQAAVAIVPFAPNPAEGEGNAQNDDSTLTLQYQVSQFGKTDSTYIRSNGIANDSVGFQFTDGYDEVISSSFDTDGTDQYDTTAIDSGWTVTFARTQEPRLPKPPEKDGSETGEDNTSVIEEKRSISVETSSETREGLAETEYNSNWDKTNDTVNTDNSYSSFSESGDITDFAITSFQVARSKDLGGLEDDGFDFNTTVTTIQTSTIDHSAGSSGSSGTKAGAVGGNSYSDFYEVTKNFTYLIENSEGGENYTGKFVNSTVVHATEDQQTINDDQTTEDENRKVLTLAHTTEDSTQNENGKFSNGSYYFVNYDSLLDDGINEYQSDNTVSDAVETKIYDRITNGTTLHYTTEENPNASDEGDHCGDSHEGLTVDSLEDEEEVEHDLPGFPNADTYLPDGSFLIVRGKFQKISHRDSITNWDGNEFTHYYSNSYDDPQFFHTQRVQLNEASNYNWNASNDTVSRNVPEVFGNAKVTIYAHDLNSSKGAANYKLNSDWTFDPGKLEGDNPTVLFGVQTESIWKEEDSKRNKLTKNNTSRCYAGGHLSPVVLVGEIATILSGRTADHTTYDIILKEFGKSSSASVLKAAVKHEITEAGVETTTPLDDGDDTIVSKPTFESDFFGETVEDLQDGKPQRPEIEWNQEYKHEIGYKKDVTVRRDILDYEEKTVQGDSANTLVTTEGRVTNEKENGLNTDFVNLGWYDLEYSNTGGIGKKAKAVKLSAKTGTYSETEKKQTAKKTTEHDPGGNDWYVRELKVGHEDKNVRNRLSDRRVKPENGDVVRDDPVLVLGEIISSEERIKTSKNLTYQDGTGSSEFDSKRTFKETDRLEHNSIYRKGNDKELQFFLDMTFGALGLDKISELIHFAYNNLISAFNVLQSATYESTWEITDVSKVIDFGNFSLSGVFNHSWDVDRDVKRYDYKKETQEKDQPEALIEVEKRLKIDDKYKLSIWHQQGLSNPNYEFEYTIGKPSEGNQGSVEYATRNLDFQIKATANYDSPIRTSEHFTYSENGFGWALGPGADKWLENNADSTPESLVVTLNDPIVSYDSQAAQANQLPPSLATSQAYFENNFEQQVKDFEGDPDPKLHLLSLNGHNDATWNQEERILENGIRTITAHNAFRNLAYEKFDNAGRARFFGNKLLTIRTKNGDNPVSEIDYPESFDEVILLPPSLFSVRPNLNSWNTTTTRSVLYLKNVHEEFARYGGILLKEVVQALLDPEGTATYYYQKGYEETANNIRSAVRGAVDGFVDSFAIVDAILYYGFGFEGFGAIEGHETAYAVGYGVGMVSGIGVQIGLAVLTGGASASGEIASLAASAYALYEVAEIGFDIFQSSSLLGQMISGGAEFSLGNIALVGLGLLSGGLATGAFRGAGSAFGAVADGAYYSYKKCSCRGRRFLGIAKEGDLCFVSGVPIWAYGVEQKADSGLLLASDPKLILPGENKQASSSGLLLTTGSVLLAFLALQTFLSKDKKQKSWADKETQNLLDSFQPGRIILN